MSVLLAKVGATATKGGRSKTPVVDNVLFVKVRNNWAREGARKLVKGLVGPGRRREAGEGPGGALDRRVDSDPEHLGKDLHLGKDPRH